jgi:hypothetical protein
MILQHYDGVCEISFLSDTYNREHILEKQYLQRGIKFTRVYKCSQEITITRSTCNDVIDEIVMYQPASRSEFVVLPLNFICNN